MTHPPPFKYGGKRRYGREKKYSGADTSRARYGQDSADDPPLSVLDLIADAAVFGAFFGGPSWFKWRVFLRALFALPLEQGELDIYQRHTGRATPPATPFKEAALICGRRAGKSRVLALIAVYLACFFDYVPYVAVGEIPCVAVIASDRKQGRVILRYVAGLLRAVPMLASLISEETAESITLTTGVSIEIHASRIASPRGRTFIAVLADEIAFWRDETSANPDAEVLNAVKPGLATIPNSMLLLASTPHGRKGVLWETYRRNYGVNDAPTLVWQAATLDMNPALNPQIVADAREQDPEAARAEYEAEFRDDVVTYAPRTVIDACVYPQRFEIAPQAGAHYVAFVDPSGGSSDSMTLAIAHRDAEGRAILDAVREFRPPFSPEAVVADFASLLHSYRVTRVRGDRYAGEWPRERFAVYGITYVPSEQTKSEIYVAFLPLLNSGRVEMLDSSRLIAQLAGLERRTSRGGRDSIDHAPGAHDDVANSVAGALVLAAAQSRKSYAERLAERSAGFPSSIVVTENGFYFGPSVGRRAPSPFAYRDETRITGTA